KDSRPSQICEAKRRGKALRPSCNARFALPHRELGTGRPHQPRVRGEAAGDSELKQLMKPEEIGPWLLSEMEEFEGLTPADLISKGETGRLWASLFYLRSGMPE